MAKKQSLEKKKMIRAQSLQKKEDRAKEEAALLNRCLGLLGVLVAAEIYFWCGGVKKGRSGAPGW